MNLHPRLLRLSRAVGWALVPLWTGQGLGLVHPLETWSGLGVVEGGAEASHVESRLWGPRGKIWGIPSERRGREVTERGGGS